MLTINRLLNVDLVVFIMIIVIRRNFVFEGGFRITLRLSVHLNYTKKYPPPH